jgi:hypothetical protein
MADNKLGETLDGAEQEFHADLAASDFCGPNWADGVPADEVALVLAEEYETRCRFRTARDNYIDAVERELEEELARFEANKHFRPDIPWFCKSGANISAALAKVELLDRVGENFHTRREKIDAEFAYERAWRLHNLAYERREANMAKQQADRVAYRSAKPKRREYQRAKFVRVSGIKIPRSM